MNLVSFIFDYWQIYFEKNISINKYSRLIIIHFYIINCYFPWYDGFMITKQKILKKGRDMEYKILCIFRDFCCKLFIKYDWFYILNIHLSIQYLYWTSTFIIHIDLFSNKIIIIILSDTSYKTVNKLRQIPILLSWLNNIYIGNYVVSLKYTS